ncbi:PKD domain-containing protein [Halorubrum ruber]|uniref:PKD domain-containing protein n=1 Tax=Halorubrum ruber TaxID=2982524 RepID=A0A8T8LLH0_9EURY|nr:PKD domain-containing protein [Halorubrum ruber]QUO47756.1 PKD domain-containing protein [Halorubrum ruber]
MNDTAHGYLRQTITALVALSLLFTVFGPVGIVAADPSVSVEQTADSTTVTPGETVTLTTQFDVAELNAPQLSAGLPDGWAIESQSATGPVAYNDGTWTWLAGDNDGVNVSYTVEYTVGVPADASPGQYAITADGSALSPADSVSTADSDSTTITVQEPEQNEDPTASFTASPSAPEPGETVSFDASGSSDDGSIASYEWDFDGDGDVDATGAQAATAFDAAGDYDVELTVTDDDGATDTATQTVSVSDAPDPASFQVSALNVESSVTQGDDAAVTATVENAGDESDTQTVTLAVDGGEVDSESVTLDGDASQQVNFTAATAGLTVGDHDVTVSTDDDSASTAFEVTADEPENQPPTADAGDDQTVAEGDSVTLDASGSSDADGDGLSYDWTQTGGTDVTLSDASSATPSFAAPDVDGDETLAFEVEVSDGAATDADAVAVTVEDADDAAPPTDGASTAVSLSSESELVAVGDAAEYDVVVESADGGVGAYSMTVTVDDPSVASITGANLSGVENGGLTDVQIAADGSSVTVEAVLIDTDDSGNVSLGTVTVESATEGSTNVSLDVSELGDEAGSTYEVTGTSGATLEASTLVVGDSENPAQDLDGDGDFEDVNGDGTVDVLDVQTLFADRDGAAVQNAPQAFDFNGDGEFTLVDIQLLFAQETE